MPRIPYAASESLEDPEIAGYLATAKRRGTPRAESQLIRANVPAVIRSFSHTMDTVFHEGIVDHSLKELCRVYIAQSLDCRYCSTQRSTHSNGLAEEDYGDLASWRSSHRFDPRQKAALGWAEAILWDPGQADDALWAALHQHFTTQELVELGYFLSVCAGQGRWIATLDMEQLAQFNPTEARRFQAPAASSR